MLSIHNFHFMLMQPFLCLCVMYMFMYGGYMCVVYEHVCMWVHVTVYLSRGQRMMSLPCSIPVFPFLLETGSLAKPREMLEASNPICGMAGIRVLPFTGSRHNLRFCSVCQVDPEKMISMIYCLSIPKATSEMLWLCHLSDGPVWLLLLLIS